MLSQVDQTRPPSFRIGMEQGLQQGEVLLLKRQIQRRFGPVAPGQQARLEQLDRERLEQLGEDLFDFTRIEDLEDWLDRHRPAWGCPARGTPELGRRQVMSHPAPSPSGRGLG